MFYLTINNLITRISIFHSSSLGVLLVDIKPDSILNANEVLRVANLPLDLL